MDAINRHRIVRMATSEEGGDACGEWGVVNPDYEAGLEAYCAELERLVESIYSEATDDNDRKYTLDNGTVEGSTYVTVNLSSKDATMAVLRKLFASMRRAVYEHFHPEIDKARQERIQADLVKNPTIWKYKYDEATETLVNVTECAGNSYSSI